jgi:16S rRNA (guanine966-N2)-methyltransferase
VVGQVVTRIIAGSAKGVPLKVPQAGTRPTSDRVRESVFSGLDHLLGGWDDLVVLDLFAGSGAMGLEALSRGAAKAVLVESAKPACAVIASNAAKTRLAADIVQEKSEVYLSRSTAVAFDVVFADPPYDMPAADVDAVIRRLIDGDWLADHAVIVIERSDRAEDIDWPDCFKDITRRRFGNTSVSRAVWYVSDDRTETDVVSES